LAFCRTPSINGAPLPAVSVDSYIFGRGKESIQKVLVGLITSTISFPLFLFPLSRFIAGLTLTLPLASSGEGRTRSGYTTASLLPPFSTELPLTAKAVEKFLSRRAISSPPSLACLASSQIAGRGYNPRRLPIRAGRGCARALAGATIERRGAVWRRGTFSPSSKLSGEEVRVRRSERPGRRALPNRGNPRRIRKENFSSSPSFPSDRRGVVGLEVVILHIVYGWSLRSFARASLACRRRRLPTLSSSSFPFPSALRRRGRRRCCLRRSFADVGSLVRNESASSAQTGGKATRSLRPEPRS